MYNKCIFIGRLTKDVEQINTKTGTTLAKFGLAVNNKYKKDGQLIEETMFIDCVAFAKTAENMINYTKKGMLVLVEGKLKLDTWQDAKTGQNRYKHTLTVDVVKFLEFKDSVPELPKNTNEVFKQEKTNSPTWNNDEPPF